MKNTRANIVIFKAENVLQPYVVGKVGIKKTKHHNLFSSEPTFLLDVGAL